MSASRLGRDPVEELAEEFAGRLRRGERPSLSEYTDRYPHLADEIRELFPAMVVMEKFGSVADPLTGARAPSPAGCVADRLGDFRILREIGRGGMGIVYEAIQESLGRHVALKVLAGPRATGTFLERFRREAKSAARLHHTNIVPVFGVGEAEGAHYFAMQFIPGHGLDVVLAEVRRLRGLDIANPGDERASAAEIVARSVMSGSYRPAADTESLRQEITAVDSSVECDQPAIDFSDVTLASRSEQRYFREAARLCVQAADALHYAHGQGVLHRDIKPSNLLLDSQGTLWITDFGLAKADDSNDLTSTGDIVGTIRYMAPERFRGQADARSDVYAMGMTLYELLTLRPAFVDSDRLRLVDRLATESPDLPRSIESHIPQDLETIVLKAVARDPADRYATADALAEDLRRFLADRPILARRHSRTEQLWRWCRRNPALATATVIAAACLFAVAVVSSVYAVRLREERQVANNRLFHSLITQARANRRSHGIGQRFESLKTLDEAAALAGNLSVSDSEMLELRNEVIACLPLTDLHVAKAVPDGYRTTTTNIDFDAELQNFVRIDLEGTASLRRVADNVEIGNVPVKNWRERQPVLSPNGQFLAIGGDSTQVWHITNETQVLLIDEPQAVGFPAFCPDGTAVAIGHKKGLVRIHDLPSGRVVKELQVGQDPDYIAFHPLKPQLAVRRSSGIGVFDLNSGAKLVELAIPGGQRPWWSPDGSAISSEVDSDHSIAIWSVSANRMIGRLAGHTQSGVRHVVHSSGDLSASCSWDSRLILWNPRTGQQLLQHPWDAQGNVRLQFDRRGQRLAADVAGGQLRLWEVAAPLGYRTLVRDPLLEKAELYSCSFSPKHDLLACTMADGIAFFETSSGRFLALMKSALKNDATFEPDGSLLGNSIANGQVRWSISPGPEPGTLHISAPQLLPFPRSSFQVSCSADGRVIASAQEWGAVVRREEFGDCLIPLTPHRQAWFVAASPRGDWVATACHRSTDVYVKVWNARTGELAADLPVTLRSLPVFSPDGRWLATWGDGCRLWRVGTWEEGPKIDGRECAFSPDGRILAVETGMGAIRLLNPNSGAEFARLENPNRDHASFLAFSRDGAGLATACHDAFAVHIWDLRAIRGELAKRQLDWNLPPYPLAEEPANTPPIQLIVDPSNAKAPELKDDPEYWLEVALEHRKARRWHELIVVCTQIIDLAPNDVEAWNLRGIAYRKLVKIDDAMASFEHALELYPANPALSDNLAMLLATCPDVRKRDPHRALELAKIAIKSFPDDGSVWNTLGIVHYRLGHWNEAGSCLEKAMRLREGFKSWDLFFLAMTNQKLNRAQEARKLYDQAVQWMEKNEPQHEELLRFRAEAKDTLGIK